MGFLKDLFRRKTNLEKRGERQKHVQKFGPPPSIMKVQKSQLDNLIQQRIHFHLFDLRSPGTKPEFPNAVLTTVAGICEDMKKRSSNVQEPIIIICEDGVASGLAAKELEKLSYHNIFVLEN